jgi:hypothetical protein
MLCIMLSLTLSMSMLCIMLSVFMLNVTFYLLLCWGSYAEFSYECCYAECRYVECCYAEIRLYWMPLCWALWHLLAIFVAKHYNAELLKQHVDSNPRPQDVEANVLPLCYLSRSGCNSCVTVHWNFYVFLKKKLIFFEKISKTMFSNTLQLSLLSFQQILSYKPYFGLILADIWPVL